MSKNNDTTTTDTQETAPATAADLLASFQELGLFASQTYRPDTIELPGGKTAKFHVRELPDSKFREIYATRDRAQLIAASICDATGKAVLTVKQAAELKTVIAAQLEAIALKHSGFGPAAADEQEKLGKRLRDKGEDWFWQVLAWHLRRTVDDLRATMSRREFLGWWEFHKRNPIDPVSLYQKPAAFIAYITAAHSQAGSKRGMQHFLDALVPRSDEDEAQDWFDSLG